MRPLYHWPLLATAPISVQQAARFDSWNVIAFQVCEFNFRPFDIRWELTYFDKRTGIMLSA